EPADVISNQEPRTVRFPGKRNTRETQFNELRREEKSGTRVQTANEKQLAALARMEERIIRLEKIVTALAKSQDQLIKQSTDGHTVWPSRPVPHIRSETPEDSATLTPAPPDRQKYIDAPIPIPRAENRHAAVSPNGNVIASLHSDSKTTQVDLFDAKKGRRLSTFQLRGTGHSVQFLDDQRLQIRGDKLLHLIAVPTGNLLGTNSVSTGTTSSQVTTVGKSTDAAVVSGVPLETASSVQQLQTVRSLVTALKGLELKREAFEETQKALDRDRTLLRLEMELERTKLQRAESDLARLVESKSAESEVQGQKLSVKEAELLFEKAATVLGFKETELKTAQESQHQLATRIRKAAEELVKRFPGHPDTKKYRELLKEPGATN
ncbi:MAG: hypothetical protein H8E37_11525, partial [Planctomycetes bacterium]|nr:hypothetical protein [Planctomycetota bacterium]